MIHWAVPGLMVALACLCTGCRGSRGGAAGLQAAVEISDDQSIPLFARVLEAAYPDFVCGYADGALLFTDGERMPCDDGKEKDFRQRLDDTDIEDMFRDVYPLGVPEEPAFLSDPGRYRSEAFMMKMYGHLPEEMWRHLVRVDWFGQELLFTSVNGAADSLRAVAAELQALPRRYARYFKDSSSFFWREVRGARRRSAHGYGIAIDICTAYADYWRNNNPGAGETDAVAYRNRIPSRIVEVFEKHGFISGTKWYHYDTMHFEFRPDLLLYARVYPGATAAPGGVSGNKH